MAAQTLPTAQTLSNITYYNISPQKANIITLQTCSKIYSSNCQAATQVIEYKKDLRLPFTLKRTAKKILG